MSNNLAAPRDETYQLHDKMVRAIEESTPAGGPPAWGSITGILASQADLQSALNSKVSVSGGNISATVGLNPTITTALGNKVTAAGGNISFTTGVSGDIQAAIDLKGLDYLLITDGTAQIAWIAPGILELLNGVLTGGGGTFTISGIDGTAAFVGNVTTVSGSFLGDGSGLTNLPNRFDQELNTGDSVQFGAVSSSFSGDGSGLFNVPITSYSAIAAGTAYTLTTSYANVDFGTTDPTITIAASGNYLITCEVQTLLVSATTTNQSVGIKLRRTNNTAADIGVAWSQSFPIVTSGSQTGPAVTIVSFPYTASSGDIVTIQASLSAALGGGSAAVTAAHIVALRL